MKIVAYFWVTIVLGVLLISGVLDYRDYLWSRPVTKGTITHVNVPRKKKTVSDMQEGDTACTWIYVEPSGRPVIFPSGDLGYCWMRDVVTLKNGKFYGRFQHGDPDESSFKTYAESNIPVIVESYK